MIAYIGDSKKCTLLLLLLLLLIIIIIIIDTFIKRHKCLGYRGAGGDVNQADCWNRKVFSWRLKPCSESHSVMFAGRLFQVTGAA